MLIYAAKETPFQQYFALKMYTFSYSSYPLYLPFEMKQSCSFQNLHVIKQFYSFSYLYVLVLTNQKMFSVRSHGRYHVKSHERSHGRYHVESHGRSHGRYHVKSYGRSHGRYRVKSHGRSHGKSSIKHQTREYKTHFTVFTTHTCQDEVLTRKIQKLTAFEVEKEENSIRNVRKKNSSKPKTIRPQKRKRDEHLLPSSSQIGKLQREFHIGSSEVP